MRHLAFVFVGLVACGHASNQTPIDLSSSNQDLSGNNGSDDMNNNQVGDMGAKCTTFTPTTIAAMRSGGSGCYEVGGQATVVTIASNASSKTGTLVVQDAAGGDDSGIIAKCSTTTGTTYPCSVLATVAGIPAGHNVTISGFYGKTKTGLETLHIMDAITDGGAGAMPAAVTVTLSDAARASTLPDRRKYYQKVNATLPASTTLKAYEFAPASFAGTSTCPTTFGFGLIPSTSAATVGPACTGTSPAAPVAGTPDPAEVLVDTTFYKAFTYTSDCPCNKSGVLLTAATTFSKLSGILDFDGTLTSIMPTSNADVGK